MTPSGDTSGPVPESAAPAAPPPTPTRLPQEEDHLRVRQVVRWMIASLVMVAIGVGWPWAMMAWRHAAPPLRLGDGAAPVMAAFSGGLHTAPFPGNGAAAAADGAAPDLEHFAWVDRAAGVVRLPIDDAITVWLVRHGEPGARDEEASP